MRPVRVGFVLAALLGSAGYISAATVHVPLDEPTIQAGIDAAIAGDTVLVECGTYFEHDILMKAGVCLRSASGQPDCAVIDAMGLGRGVIFYLSEDAAIEGFTITGGFVNANDMYLGRGGGVTIRDCSPRIRRCAIRANEAEAGGGGLSALRSSAVIEECIFSGNTGVDGGAIHCNHASPQIAWCVLYGNHATVWGGAVCAENESSPVLSNCTLADNWAWSGGGLWCVAWCHPRLDNCIVAFSSHGEGIHVYDNPSVPSDIALACCDVYGNAGGNYGGAMDDPTGTDGNISTDPIFCDLNPDDYRLFTHSPCLPEHNECGVLIGALGAGCESLEAPGDGSPDRAKPQVAARPNPFHGGTTIAFRLPVPGAVELSVFDPAGRRVRTRLQDVELAPRPHHARWDGRDDDGRVVPSGVYLLRLTTPSDETTGRTLLTR